MNFIRKLICLTAVVLSVGAFAAGSAKADPLCHIDIPEIGLFCGK